MIQSIRTHFQDSLGIDDEDLIQEIYAEYIKETKKNCKIIGELLAQGQNSKELCGVIHTLKGCILNVGHAELEQFAIDMNNAAKQNDPDECRRNFQLLNSNYKKIYESL
ncbi:MAG: Hpt domain-containing protein [Lentisphaeria bacterium]